MADADFREATHRAFRLVAAPGDNWPDDLMQHNPAMGVWLMRRWCDGLETFAKLDRALPPGDSREARLLKLLEI